MNQADAHFAGRIVGSYNNALQVLAPACGVQHFKMSGLQPKCTPGMDGLHGKRIRVRSVL